ncbi:MAG: hypothetical protein SF066_18855 [Thermoanaerobaculia bacterium]|nr:hypothetical protein [Thermoanaerobaculia bacterium]
MAFSRENGPLSHLPAELKFGRYLNVIRGFLGSGRPLGRPFSERGRRVRLGLLLALLLAPAASAGIAIEVPRFNVAGRDLRAEVTVTDVPANRKLRIFVLLDGHQVHTVDLGAGVHSLRFERLRPPPGRHELALQVGRERAAGFVRVVPWWAAASALVLPVALLLLAFERLRRRC